jgi:hypothetical protein
VERKKVVSHLRSYFKLGNNVYADITKSNRDAGVLFSGTPPSFAEEI